ncbi:MAG: isoprenylcysteine carboxylmethyltransferase family protein [Anaerolineae bacterium]|nr:isoprenylcysteine carboxylmethyltransferase family protein [Anaerolineae bacterium]
MRVLRAMMVGLITLVVYLGVSLVGWGLGSLGSYYASGPRTAHTVLVALFATAAGVQGYHSMAGIRGRRGVRAKRVQRQTLVSAGVILAMYVALFFLPYADRRELATLPLGGIGRWVGVGPAAAGFILVFWSGVALGSMYSKEVTIQADHRLVTTGLYARLRHPRYLGVLLLALGLSLIFRSWVGLVATVALVPVLVMRIRDEEQSLAAEFGEAWAAYLARSWRLVPGVW